MQIREAKGQDKAAWDSFVNTQEGHFEYYFDYRSINKNIIQLIVESDKNRFESLCCLIREEKSLYSSMQMNDILFRKDHSVNERYRAASTLLDYIEKNYSNRCSTFLVKERITSELTDIKNPNKALIDHQFRLRNGTAPNLPCVHILPLKAPFEEYIWKGLWSQKFRKALNQAAKMGIRVVQDRELKYLGNYIEMMSANYKRHGVRPPNRTQIIEEFNIFKDKIKLFVALLDNKPVMMLECHYTPSTCYLARIGSFAKDTDDANKFCFKTAIEDACNNGYQFADLGLSYTEGLAKMKDRFKFSRVPLRYYEKRYSVYRTFMELVPRAIDYCLYDRRSLWDNRKMFWDMIVRW